MPIRLSILPLVSFVAAALAGCGGGFSGPAMNATIPDAAAIRQASACYTRAQQPKWIFKGPCRMVTVTSKGISVTLPRYKGVAVSAALPANTAKSSIPITLVDAIGVRDIGTYKGKAFPLYINKLVTTVIYFQDVNHFKKSVIKAKGPLIFTVRAHFPGAPCSLASLQGSRWTKLPVQASPKGGVLTLTLPATGVELLPGATYGVVICS